MDMQQESLPKLKLIENDPWLEPYAEGLEKYADNG